MDNFTPTMASIAGQFKVSYIDEFWVAHKPWLKDRLHHYKAYLRYYAEPRKSDNLHRNWLWVEAFGETAEEALSKLDAEIKQRIANKHMPSNALSSGDNK